MRLIEIANLVNGVEDRNVLLQERRRPLSAFNLANMALAQAGDSQETVPPLAGRHLLRVAL